ncbi:unnamed protein product [Brugia pahangi]|uniref:Uncharacterized protein n=1 Tax=Brugia pahangi TaxID=6280 RepID=A0A0N4TKA8_BRUPA|nr:unnamed protein product [Brugia pahangi]
MFFKVEISVFQTEPEPSYISLSGSYFVAYGHFSPAFLTHNSIFSTIVSNSSTAIFHSFYIKVAQILHEFDLAPSSVSDILTDKIQALLQFLTHEIQSRSSKYLQSRATKRRIISELAFAAYCDRPHVVSVEQEGRVFNANYGQNK